MSDGLTRMPGHRTAPDPVVQEGGILADFLPFLPTDYEAAMPLYISMALLFIVISRAARRKSKTRLRQTSPRRENGQVPVAQRKVVTTSARRLRPHDGHWGDG